MKPNYEDLSPPQRREVDLSIKHGFDYETDSNRGHLWCSFSKGPWRVWIARRWSSARLEDGMYTEHRFYDNLEEALSETAKRYLEDEGN